MIDHVDHIGNLGRCEGSKPTLSLSDALRIGRAKIGREEDVPVGKERLVVDVEEELSTLVPHSVGHRPKHAQIPLRHAVAELADIDPECALAVGDDVAYLQVTVQACCRLRSTMTGRALKLRCTLRALTTAARSSSGRTLCVSSHSASITVARLPERPQ